MFLVGLGRLLGGGGGLVNDVLSHRVDVEEERSEGEGSDHEEEDEEVVELGSETTLVLRQTVDVRLSGGGGESNSDVVGSNIGTVGDLGGGEVEKSRVNGTENDDVGEVLSRVETLHVHLEHTADSLEVLGGVGVSVIEGDLGGGSISDVVESVLDDVVHRLDSVHRLGILGGKEPGSLRILLGHNESGRSNQDEEKEHSED
ncbi:hypothetical protein PFISCL1PPCAC_27035, partial [Pristionchus fissidentatus]